MRKRSIVGFLVAGALGLLLAAAPYVGQAKPCTACRPCTTCKTRDDVMRTIAADGRPPHELWMVFWIGTDYSATWFMTEADADAFVANSISPVAGPFHTIMNGYDK